MPAASRSNQSGPSGVRCVQLQLPAPTLQKGELRVSLPSGTTLAAAQRALQHFETVISQTQFDDVRYSRPRILFGRERQPIALTVDIAAEPQWFGSTLSHLCSDQLVLNLSADVEGGYCLKVGLVPPKGFFAVSISGVPVNVTAQDLEASSTPAVAAAGGFSFLPGSVRPHCTDSGLVCHDSYTAVLISSTSAPPSELSFGEHYAGCRAKVRTKRLAIPCLPVLPCMRQAAQEPAPDRGGQTGSPSSGAEQEQEQDEWPPLPSRPQPHSRRPAAASGPRHSEPGAGASTPPASLPHHSDSSAQAAVAPTAEVRPEPAAPVGASPSDPAPQQPASAGPSPENDGFTTVVVGKATARAARRAAREAHAAACAAQQALRHGSAVRTPLPRVGRARPRPDRAPGATPWTPKPKTARPLQPA